MSVIGSNVLAGASGQSAGGGGGAGISRSLRFNASDSAHLSRTPSAAGNRKTWTYSTWLKRTALGTEGGIFSTYAGAHPNTSLFWESEALKFHDYTGSYNIRLGTAAVFRDPSAWYHIVLAYNSTESTASDRAKIWVNGVLQTLSGTTVPSGFETDWNSATAHNIGRYAAYFDGYMADVHFIDGQALAPTDFGETNTDNLWVPKAYAGTYGWFDNSQTWSSGAYSGTAAQSGYETAKAFNGVGVPGDSFGTGKMWGFFPGTATLTLPAAITLTASSTFEIYAWHNTSSNGNITFTCSNGSVAITPVDSANIASTVVSNPYSTFGASITAITLNVSNDWTALAGLIVDGKQLIDSGVSLADNSFHLDFADNSSNAALGTDTSGVSPANNWTVNNLTASALGLATANQGMDVVTYTGNGTTNTAISGLAFQPDFVWIKARSAAYDHMLNDSVRGATKSLRSNLTDAEGTNANDLQSFDSNGFTVGYGGYVNGNGQTFVAWCWKAGGAASSNTAGTITSSVSANNTYGFSIVSFTDGGSACTVGHGLSSAPKMIFAKFRGSSGNWSVYHEATGNDHRLKLNLSDAKQSGNDWWNATSPTSSVFSLGSNLVASTTQIAYCWSEIPGFSKFGAYTGTGSDQTIDCGFKPAFVLIKRVSGGGSWVIIDSARGVTKKLAADLNVVENDSTYLGGDTTSTVEFLSNGFKLTSTSASTHGTSNDYIYAAYASKPSGEGVDSLFDTPSNGDTASDTGAGGEITGNYATWNPLVQSSSTFSNGNLQATTSGGSGYPLDMANFYTPAGTGKWYWEFELDALSGSNYTMVGMLPGDSDYVQGASNTPHLHGGISVYVGYNGDVNAASGAATAGTATATFAVGDILGWAFDAENGTLQCYKNGVSQGTQFTNIRTDIGWVFCVTDYDNSATATYVINFGQRVFAYPVSGYKCLNTANLSSTIADGSLYFDTKLYTGNSGTQALTMSNSTMSPGFVWLKERSASGDHELFDSIRGVHKYLESNSTNAESTSTTTLTSFDSNGFTLGSSSLVNDNNVTYAAWAWDAGSSNTTIAAGSLNSSLYNQSDNWSSRVTGTPFSGYSVATMFDGSASGICYANTGSSITFTPTTPITVTSSIRIYGAQSSSTEFIKINDNAATNVPSNVGWFTPDTGTAITSLSKLEFYTTNGSYASGVGAIEIDGKLLVDASVSITTPSIASTVRSSPESGFSIVTYTGGAANSTVGHGLNAEPYVIICKSRTQNSAGWDVYHRSIGKDKFLILNQNYAEGVYSNHWGTSGPDSTTFGVSQANYFNNHGDMVALCFAPVEGYSAMGSYVGNGSADGPFVFTGFKTAWLMVKSSSNSGEHWLILDAARDSYNVADATIYANLNNAEAEASALGIDILSNGFKPRGTNAGTNASGYTYIYLAFASHPFASNGGLAR